MASKKKGFVFGTFGVGSNNQRRTDRFYPLYINSGFVSLKTYFTYWIPIFFPTIKAVMDNKRTFCWIFSFLTTVF